MSTAVFSGALGPVLVQRELQDVPGGLAGSSTRSTAQGNVFLTIHRISETHHGRTLLMLGHAAEHLANSRRFEIGGLDEDSDSEAIHILMGLSRSVFDDFAGRYTRRRRVEQWLIQYVAELFDGHRERRGRVMSDKETQGSRATC